MITQFKIEVSRRLILFSVIKRIISNSVVKVQVIAS